jgi:hypothetical protein
VLPIFNRICQTCALQNINTSQGGSPKRRSPMEAWGDGRRRLVCVTGRGTAVGARCFTGQGQRRHWCPSAWGRWCRTTGWGRGTSSPVLLPPRWHSDGGGDEGAAMVASKRSQHGGGSGDEGALNLYYKVSAVVLYGTAVEACPSTAVHRYNRCWYLNINSDCTYEPLLIMFTTYIVHYFYFVSYCW